MTSQHQLFECRHNLNLQMHSQLPSLTLFALLIVLCIFPGLPSHLLRLPGNIFSASLYDHASTTSQSPAMTSQWSQKLFSLFPRGKGSYLITSEIQKNVPEISHYRVGLLNLFVQHTSCGLSLNENWDSDVREDMTDAMDRIVPEDKKGDMYRHSAEGLDDMPVCGDSTVAIGVAFA